MKKFIILLFLFSGFLIFGLKEVFGDCANGCCSWNCYPTAGGGKVCHCWTCCDSGVESGGGEDKYENSPEGHIDVFNCNEIVGWACDPSCTGDEPSCSTTINISRMTFPKTYVPPTPIQPRIRLDNCTSCNWSSNNLNEVFCSRCPGNCSSLKCSIKPQFRRVAQVSANLNRPDLTRVDACKKSPDHGFRLIWPNNDEEHTDLVNLYPYPTTNYVYVVALNIGSGMHVSLNGMIPKTITCQLPTCSLSLNKNLAYSSTSSNTITVSFNGSSYNKDIRIWIRRKDLAPVSILASQPNVYIYHQTNPDRYYYMVKTCNPGGDPSQYRNCSTSYTLPQNLPPGEYI